MRYCKDYHGFKTKHWERLWQSNIPDIKSVKNAIRSKGFVAIDAEPWGRAEFDSPEISQIGVAYVPPASSLPPQTQHGTSPPSVGFLVSRHQIKCHCIQVDGRAQGVQRRETFGFGQVHNVVADHVEEELVKIVTSFQTNTTKPKPILIGFGMNFELRAISALYPRLTDCFSSWVDLQELAGEVSGTPMPGLRDTLIALGYDKDFRAVRPVRVAHNAGNDAVRILAVLLNLAVLSTNLTIHRAPKRRAPLYKPFIDAERKFWRRKPGPRELYPYIVRVKLGGDMEAFTARMLHQYFYSYILKAAAIDPGLQYGWVCLRSPDEVQRFVSEVHGKNDGDRTWSAISDYDPSVEPMTSAELIEWRRAKLESQREAKRLERAAKRVEGDLDDVALSSVFGDVD